MILVLAKQRNIATEYENRYLIFVARAVSIGCMIEDLWTMSEIFVGYIYQQFTDVIKQ